MYFKILMKDLRRKKIMNIILLLFMIVSSALMGSSLSMFYSTISSIDYTKGKANVSDVIQINNSYETGKEFLKEMKALPDKLFNELYTEETIVFKDEDVTVQANRERTTEHTTLMGYWVQKIPAKYNLVFDEDDKPLRLKEGEVAVPRMTSEKRGMKIGDWITIKLGEKQYSYKVAHICKDFAFGSEMLGAKRYLVADSDYEKMIDNLPNENKGYVTSLTKGDHCTTDDVIQQITDLDTILIGGFNFTSDLMNMQYVTNMLLAGILIIVSVILIIIAFMILRFTIIHSIQEEYKEIGIMKAIGIKNRPIRNIYMIKYLAISVVGGIFGFMVSMPMGKLLCGTIEGYLILGNSTFKVVLSLIGVLLVVGLTIVFCYRCTKKIQKFSAMDAIRSGSNGERFKGLAKFPNFSETRVPVWLFLGIRDLRTSFRKFVILMITFLLGTSIMIIPLNAANTLKSDNMMKMLGYAKLDYYIDIKDFDNEHPDQVVENLKKEFNQVVKGTDVWADYSVLARISRLDDTRSKQVVGFKSINKSAKEYHYMKGEAPLHDNEIALTEKVADYLKVDIGDTIHIKLNGDSHDLIISGLFETVMNMGYGFRLSEQLSIQTPDKSSFLFSCRFNNRESKADNMKTLQHTFKDMKFHSTEEYLIGMLGSFLESVDDMIRLLLIIVGGVVFLITILLVKMLATKEVPEIAMLKSIGFKNKTIRLWQLSRIVIILIFGILFGTIFANTVGNYLIGLVFRVAGTTNVMIYTKRIQVYVIIPLFLFIVTTIASFFSLGIIRKTKIWEINNQE